MSGILSVRLARGVGLLSLALFTAGVVSFSPLPTTGASLSTTHPAMSVNRALKGDRLPLVRPTVWPRDLISPPVSPTPAQPQAQIPPGCDRAFSPISSPGLAHVFRRCIT
jgi:hypothetical protein